MYLYVCVYIYIYIYIYIDLSHCSPPSFGLPPGWASFCTTRGLDRSFGFESPHSYLGTLARLFEITG